jgi:hypothetical protein
MNRSETTGPMVRIALVFAIALGTIAQAATPYLPLVGPPPMRFQVVKSLAKPTVALAPATPLISTNQSPTDVGPKLLGDNNSAKDPNTGSASASDPSSTKRAAPSIFELPTPDLVGISPETLASYFRAISRGTNSPVIIGTFPLSFVPPLPAEKSSQATYNVK